MTKDRVFECLVALGTRHGPRERGKICQKLLAIALGAAGCTKITERGVQGVDVDVCSADGQKYTIEVKTTKSDFVPLGQKDVIGLRQRAQTDGYLPVLGVLRIGLFSEWYLARVDSLKAGRILIDSLRPHRIRHLESIIQPEFDKAICEHFEGALKNSQSYLDEILRGQNIFVED